MLESDGGKHVRFVSIHENSPQMVKVGLLNSKKILLFDFFSEVYVWVGKETTGALRKKALELGREHFEKPCRCGGWRECKCIPCTLYMYVDVCILFG